MTGRETRRRRGAEAIEFALVAPVLLTLIFGSVEYGWFMLNKVQLSKSVAAGARAGAVVAQDAAISAQTRAETVATEAWAIPGSPTFIATVVGDPQVLRIDGEVPYSSLTGLAPVPETIVASISFVRADQP